MNSDRPKQPDDLLDTDARSPGEAQIEKVKARPRSAFHFGLMGMIWLMVGSAILVALPQGLGIEYIDFFGLWILVIYGCAPLLCWSIYLFIPARFGAWRLLIAGVTGALIVLPAWIAAGLSGGLFEVIGGSLYFWVPQCACIAAVQYFLFSKGRTKTFWR